MRSFRKISSSATGAQSTMINRFTQRLELVATSSMVLVTGLPFRILINCVRIRPI